MKKTIKSVFETDKETIIDFTDGSSMAVRENAAGLFFLTGEEVEVTDSGEIRVLKEPEPAEKELFEKEDSGVEAKVEAKAEETKEDDPWSLFELLDCVAEKKLPPEIEKTIALLKNEALKEYFKNALFESGAGKELAEWVKLIKKLSPAFKEADKSIVISAILFINEKLNEKDRRVWGRGPAAAFRFLKNNKSLNINADLTVGAILAAAGAKEPATEEEKLLAAAKILKERDIL